MRKLFEPISNILLILGGIIAIASICLFLYLRIDDLTISSPIDSSLFDHFGSFFSGVVGTIWSLASVFLFYITLHDQRSAQRFERTEATIYQLLNSYTQMIAASSITEIITKGDNKTEKITHGRNIFIGYYWILKRRFEEKSDNNVTIEDLYISLYKSSPSDLSNSSKIILYILEFIDQAKIDAFLKQRFIDMILLQISRHELVFIYYNIEFIEKFKKYKLLTTKYMFFEYIDETDIL